MTKVTDIPNILDEVFFPFRLKKQKDAVKNCQKFVYYTCAEVGASILENQEIWMRKSTCMNDYSETDYGLGLLFEAWKDKCGINLKTNLDSIFPGISQKIENKFSKWIKVFRLDTYLTCISEHDSETEDTLGRLSMWRAYGGKAGVALVLNNEVLLTATDALSAYASPVAYLSEKQFFDKIHEISSNIETSAIALKEIDERIVENAMFEMLKWAVLCTKHPGFHEEREWRIVYSPSYQPSKVIKSYIKSIDGVPQPICIIPLTDIPERDLTNLHLSKFLGHVIIGPTEYPAVISEAFVSLLKEIGIPDPHEKVLVSNIPVRH